MFRIVTTERFDVQLAELKKTYPRIDDAIDGVRWALEREPESQPVIISQPPFEGRGFKLNDFPSVPKAIVYYRILDESTVQIYAIYDTVAGPNSIAF